MTDNQVIRDLMDLRNDYFNIGGKLQKENGWKENDARIGVFAKCVNVIEPVFFSLLFCEEQLRNPAYQARFSKDHKTPPHPDETQHQVDSYIMYQQYSYAELLFASIESSLRIFVRIIDPKACNEGKASFSSISDYLLAKTNLEKYKPLLDLFRLIRNTSHNNGIYLPEKNGNKTITWKDNSFTFEVGKQILFVTFPFLIELSKDLKEMLAGIIKSEVIKTSEGSVDPTFPEGWELRTLNTDV